MTNAFVSVTVTTHERVFVFTYDCFELKTVRNSTFPSIRREVMDSFAEFQFFPRIVQHIDKKVNGVMEPQYLLQLDSTIKYTQNPTVMYLKEGEAVAINPMAGGDSIRRLPADAVIKPM